MQVWCVIQGAFARRRDATRENESAAFEPSGRPDVPGGPSRHALTTNGGAGAPRTAQFGARAQQLKLLPIAYKTVRNAAPAHSKTYQKRQHPRSVHAPHAT